MSVIKELGLYINGKWRFPSGRDCFEVFNPYDDTLLGRLPEATVEEVNEVASVAYKAFSENQLTSGQRASILNKMASLIQRDSDVFENILVMEIGKTRREARAEIKSAISAFTAASEEAKRIKGEEIPLESKGKLGFMLKVPSGPVCAITAYNAPLNQGAHKVGAALAAGCSVVLKPSPFTPFHAIHLATLLEEAGLPAGMFQLVFGSVDVGKALIESRHFARYMFTGSLPVGTDIAHRAGMRPVILEMGSNAPNIVHSDADLDQAVDACLSGYAIAGQVCTSVQRLYVHQVVLDVFAEKFVRKVSQLRVGDPLSEGTDVGPVRNDRTAERFDAVIREATDGGARVLCGGKRSGRMIQPTVLEGVTPDMTCYKEEIFLPIVCLIPYADFDEVLDAANDSIYGLQAGIFTSNINLAFKAIKKLNVGGLMINDASRFRTANMAYGGVKGSGVGREGLPYAIEQLMDVKNIVFTTMG